MSSFNRKRLNDLSADVAERIDAAILDLADSSITGDEGYQVGSFVYETIRGDKIIYAIDDEYLYVDGFSAK